MMTTASPATAMTLNVAIIAVKIGLRTSRNTPEVTRAVRSLASTPTRQESAQYHLGCEDGHRAQGCERQAPAVDERLLQDVRWVQAGQRGGGGGHADGQGADGAQAIDPPLERPTPGDQAPIAGVTGTTPVNCGAHHAHEQQERHEHEHCGDRQRCSAPFDAPSSPARPAGAARPAWTLSDPRVGRRTPPLPSITAKSGHAVSARTPTHMVAGRGGNAHRGRVRVSHCPAMTDDRLVEVPERGRIG